MRRRRAILGSACGDALRPAPSLETHDAPRRSHRGGRRAGLADVLRCCRDEPALRVRRADGPHRGGLPQVPRARRRPALRGRLPPVLGRPQPPAAHQGAGRRGRRAGAHRGRLWPIANWLEREVWDMFGVRFAGHPDLAPAPDVRGVRRPRAAQGLPDQPPPAVDRPGARSSDPWPRRPPGRSCWARGAGTGSGQNLQVGVGPAHPAMHGIIRIIAELDGEVIRKADVEIGYLHRAFEKDCEVGGWNNAIPYTDRLNYVSPLINNFAYASAVEKLLGIEVTERCKYIRTVMSRDLAGLRPPHVRGRLGHGAGRLHGLPLHDQGPRVPVGAGGGRDRRAADHLLRPRGRGQGRPARRLRAEGRRRPSSEAREVLDEVHRLLTGNRIFMDRMVGRRPLSREETIALRDHGAAAARGRRAATTCAGRSPHWAYDRVEFEVPTQKDGDNYARYLVRMAEMEQSMRIAEQALAAMPGGCDQRRLRGAADRPRRLRRPGQAGQDGGAAARADHACRRISRARTGAALRSA